MDFPKIIPNATSPDEARQLILQAIHQHELSICELKTQLNTFAPIAFLPSEVLLRIFTLIEDDARRRGSMRYVPISQVCRFWRSVALDASYLWAELTCQNAPGTAALLQRSRGAPLTVTLHRKMSNVLIDQIAEHLPRIRSFTSQEWYEDHLVRMHERIEPFTKRIAPQLESLSLDCYLTKTGSPWLLPSTTFRQVDRLRKLSLLNIRLDWNDSPLPDRLEELSMKTYTPLGQFTWQELILALNRMPALRSLRLDRMLPASDVALMSGSACLPALESVFLCKPSSLKVLTTFLNTVELPAHLKVFNVTEFAKRPVTIGDLRDFCQAFSSALPTLCSSVRYMWIDHDMEQQQHGPQDFVGKIYFCCFITPNDGCSSYLGYSRKGGKPGNIELELGLASNNLRTRILALTLAGLRLPGITHLGVSISVEIPELLALLEALPELQVLQAYEPTTKRLLKVFHDLQARAGVDGALILPKLEELHIRSIGWMEQEDDRIGDDTSQEIQKFLELRQSRGAELHKLRLDTCPRVSHEMIERLRPYVQCITWDGMYRNSRGK